MNSTAAIALAATVGGSALEKSCGRERCVSMSQSAAGPATKPPAAPTNLTATAISKSQINLTWRDNSSNETGFRIQRCKGSTCTNFAQVASVGVNVKSYSNTGLTANTTYRYRVYAYNATGSSAYSNIVTATTLKR